MTVTLEIIDRDLVTPITVLDQPYAIEWSRERLDSGAGAFTIAHDDPSIQNNRPQVLQRDNVVILERPGARPFCFLTRRMARPRRDVWDPITVAGPGAIELMRSALLYPTGGLGTTLPSDEVQFGWMHPSFDDSGWDAPADGGRQDRVSPPPMLAPKLIRNPEGWPYPAAHWIMPEPTSGDPPSHPLGEWPARGTFTLPATTDVVIFWTSDNGGVLWLDGVEIASTAEEYSWRNFETITGVLGAGTHSVAVLTRNLPLNFATGFNPTGFLFVIGTVNADGTLGEVLFHSGQLASWKVLPFPDPFPQVTPGFILKTVFDAAVARGFIAAISIDFDELVDSAGRPWPREVEIAGMVGTDSVLALAERLRDVGVWADFVPASPGPGFVFQAFGESRVDRGLTPDVGATTVRPVLPHEVSTETEGDHINVVLVRSEFEWFERPDPSLDTDRREGFLSLGLVASSTAAAGIGELVLSDFSNIRQQTPWTTQPQPAEGDPQPDDDYEVGDIVVALNVDPEDIAGDWVESDVLVDTIAGVIDEAGRVLFRHETSPA